MEGDVVGRMRLDIADVDIALRRVERMMKKTAASFRPITSKVSQDMKAALNKAVLKHKVAAAEIALAHKKAALKVSRNWWDSFGKVALGFTVAYRAMNAFELGLQKFGATLLGAIQESGELAAFQAKQALWFKMYSKDVITYAEAYKRAAVNARALADASIYSMATLEELTTGFDELGQAGIIAGKESTKMFADLVSFTTLIAQTVGSTTRQIRQEFQALAEGQVRTTNILIRTMLRMGVISKEDVSNLKRMVDTEKIILKIVTKISAEWSEVERHIISADPLTAMRFWEKHVKAIWRQTITLASALEDVDNIFADVFVKHAKKLREALEKEPETGLVLFVLTLRDTLDLALISFTKFTNFVAFSTVAIKNMSDELILVGKVIGTVLAIKLGEFFVKLSLGMTKFLLIPLKSITARILALPALFVATAIAIESLSPKFELTEKDIKTFGKTTVSVIDWMLERIKTSRKAWEDYLYGPGGEPSYKESWQKFRGEYEKNAKRHLGELKEALKPMLAEIDKLFADLGTPKDPKAVKEEVDAMLEGLTSLLEDVGKTDDKVLKERLKLSQRFRDDIQKLTLDEADFKMYKMQQVSDRAEALGVDEVLAKEWFVAQVDAIYDKAMKKRIAEAEKEAKAFLQQERQLLSLLKQMHRDAATNKFARTKQNLDDEFQMRMLKIQELTDAESTHNEKAWKTYLEMAKTKIEERSELERLALLAHTMKLKHEMEERSALIDRMQKDDLIRRLEKIEADAKAELKIRLRTIKDITEAGKEREELETAAYKAYTEKLLVINGTFVDGLSRGIQNYADNLETEFEMGVSYAKKTAEAMQSAFSDLFFDVMMGEFTRWEDYIKSMLRGISRMLSDLLSQLLTKKIISVFTVPAVKGPKVTRIHEGRIPLSVLPRFHDGLFPNEMPAVIRKDESVLTPKQMNSLLSDKGENYNIFINAVDAQSFMELTRRNPQAIIRPFVEAITNNDSSLRGSLKMAMGR